MAAVTLASGCAGTDRAAETIPGPSLEGPNVVRYPLAPYEFKPGARKELRQGVREAEGCALETRAYLDADDVREVQEVVVASDPDTCRYLLVTGEPDDG